MTAGFIGERLMQARTMRGLTQINLQALSSVSRVSISNYESEKQLPRPETISALANALAIPESFFFKPLPPPIEEPIFFRSLAAQTKASREQWRQHSALTDELLNIFLEHLDFPPLCIPCIDLGKKWEMTPDATIEEYAEETRKALGLGNGPIPHLARLVENKGAVVMRVDTGNTEDGFSRWLVDKTVPVIFVSKETTACRDRMSIAHELGHLVLHRTVTPDTKNIKVIENQAKTFASAFLMPAKEYATDMRCPSLATFMALKRKWGVSIAAQTFRCNHLGFLSEEASRGLFITIARRGWKRIEPFDDVMPLEEANLIVTGVDMLAEEYGVRKDELPAVLGYSPSDAASLLGLPIDFFAPPTTAQAPPVSSKIIPFKSASSTNGTQLRRCPKESKNVF